MLCIVSTNRFNGGVLQFSVTLEKTLLGITDCKLFVPSSISDEYLQGTAENTVKYQAVSAFNEHHPQIISLCKKIVQEKPEMVIITENSFQGQQINFNLKKAGIPTAIVVHDILQHPYHSMSPRAYLAEFLRRFYMKRTVKKNGNIILLSDHSKKEFEKRYPKCRAKSTLLRLGAHVPSAPLLPVHTIESSESYLLFFGRIDKYKGIENLCRAYSMLKEEQKERLKLVIAGNGVFSEEEEELIRKNPTIRKIHRFIEDGEMLWLIKNAKAVVLPYIEASQSGVLPISYHFGKPVVVSNLPGLTENVDNGKTAAIYDTVEQLADIIAGFSDDQLSFDSEQISEYYHKNFNWEMNVTKLLEQIL